MARWDGSDHDAERIENSEAVDWPDEDYDEPTIPCPHCGRDILEDSERCPHCENYISQEDSPTERKPWWIIIGVVACLYVVYRWSVWW